MNQRSSRKYCGFRPLTSSIHLYTAAIERTPILVFTDSELTGSGTIEAINEDFVTINGIHYPRETSTFTFTE